MSWVGTRVPWVSKPGLLGNFPPHRGRSLPSEDIPFPLKTLGTSRAGHGTAEFPVSGDGAVPHPCRQVSQGLCSQD